MNKNISASDAHILFDKLISEGIPVVAAFWSPSGLRATIRGFLDSISESNGILISVTRPISDPQQLAVPLSGQKMEFSYSDGRDIPAELKEWADKYGDTQIVIDFLKTGERLFLVFTL